MYSVIVHLERNSIGKNEYFDKYKWQNFINMNVLILKLFFFSFYRCIYIMLQESLSLIFPLCWNVSFFNLFQNYLKNSFTIIYKHLLSFIALILFKYWKVIGYIFYCCRLLVLMVLLLSKNLSKLLMKKLVLEILHILALPFLVMIP